MPRSGSRVRTPSSAPLSHRGRSRHCLAGLFYDKSRTWRRGQVVRQRPAKPSPPVRIRASPPDLKTKHADMAQLVEHHLAKVRVAGSNPVVRSMNLRRSRNRPLFIFLGPKRRSCSLVNQPGGYVPFWIEKIFKIGSCKDPRFRYYIFLRLGPPRCDCWIGRLAQGESASLTRKRSQVQIL